MDKTEQRKKKKEWKEKAQEIQIQHTYKPHKNKSWEL